MAPILNVALESYTVLTVIEIPFHFFKTLFRFEWLLGVIISYSTYENSPAKFQLKPMFGN